MPLPKEALSSTSHGLKEEISLKRLFVILVLAFALVIVIGAVTAQAATMPPYVMPKKGVAYRLVSVVEALPDANSWYLSEFGNWYGLTGVEYYDEEGYALPEPYLFPIVFYKQPKTGQICAWPMEFGQVTVIEKRCATIVPHGVFRYDGTGEPQRLVIRTRPGAQFWAPMEFTP